MDLPLGGIYAALYRLTPLTEAGLLAFVDLLSLSDQTDDDAPGRDPLGEIDEMLGLRLSRLEPRRAPVFDLHLLRIEGALSLVEDQYVLGWNSLRVARVSPDVVLDTANERLSATAGASELVLQNLNQGTVPREEDCRGRRPVAGACHDEVVQEVCVRTAHPETFRTRA